MKGEFAFVAHTKIDPTAPRIFDSALFKPPQ